MRFRLIALLALVGIMAFSSASGVAPGEAKSDAQTAAMDSVVAPAAATPVEEVVAQDMQPPPVEGEELEHWIDVNLSTQQAIARVGSMAVYVANVTTGMPGWDTPTGTYHIIYRVEDETMRSSTIGIPDDSGEGWVLPHVYYTQYFTNQGHALHYNYWKPDYVFGAVPSSHGCVGMRLAEAEFFWNFASMGTMVEVHY